MKNHEENEPTTPGEQAMIDATIDANDRVRERRFAKGLPCLLTGLTKEQWEAGRIHIVVLPVVSRTQNDTILTAADWIERIAQRHSELPKLFLDGFSESDFRNLASKLREIRSKKDGK